MTLLTPPLFTQHKSLRFEHISVDRGLSNSSIYSLFQDRRGYLWIGTRDGLNRYDGYNFKIYKYNSSDSTSLAGNLITAIAEDTSGTLWVGTDAGGLCRLDREKNNFKRYVHAPGNPNSLSGDRVTALYVDRGGTLWIGANGLNRFDQSTETFYHYQHDPRVAGSVSDNTIGAILEDRSGSLWLGTVDGLDRFDLKNDSFEHFKHDPHNPRSLSENNIWSFCEGEKGILWIGTYGGGLNKFNVGKREFLSYRYDSKNPLSLGNDKVSALCCTADNELWVGTYERGGLNILDAARQATVKFARYRGGTVAEDGLSEGRIRTIYEDRSGNVWIGTDNGLNKVARAKRFTTFLPDTVIRSLYTDRRGNLWIGTMGNGIVVLDPDKHEVARYRRGPAKDKGLSSNLVYCFHEDGFGAMWIGTWDGGLNRLERSTGRFEHFRQDPGDSKSQLGDEVNTVGEDESGRLIVKSSRGTSVLDRRTNTFRLSPGNSANRLRDKYGFLWLFDWGGLIRVDRNGNRKEFRHKPDDPGSLSDDYVTAVCEDKDGAIWVGTGGKGLNRFDRTTEAFMAITSKDGLSSDFIHAILADSEGNLWLSTDDGLCRYDPARKTFRKFDIADGLPTNSFYWGVPCMTKGGEMVFCSVRGAVAFRPSEVRPNLVPPPVVLTSFSILQNPHRLTGEISLANAIQISYQENVFSLEVAALDFTSPQKNEYAYKMEGFDKEWTYAGTRRYFTYTNLNPGAYTFRVKGSNSDGVWNEAGISVPLTITPPFWLTWWFITLVAAILLGIIVYAYNWRVDNLIQIERTRDRIARDLHDDVASTLGSVAMYTESLRRKLGKSPRATEELLGKISSLSLEAVDSMGDIVWSVSPQHDTLNDLLVHIRDLASQICTAAGIEYVVNIEEVVDDLHINVEMRKSIYLIFKEAMNNIVKHSNASIVQVSAAMSNGVFEMNVHDNGKGFETSGDARKEKPVRGHGLRSMTKRAGEIQALLTVTSKPGKGTVVFLSRKMT